jgi:hypothetical protein
VTTDLAEAEGCYVESYLSGDEIQELLRQDPSAEKDGGWQGLLVGFQKRLNKTTGHLTVTSGDMDQIQRYAFHGTRGGRQSRLLAIFGRTLGTRLEGAADQGALCRLL